MGQRVLVFVHLLSATLLSRTSLAISTNYDMEKAEALVELSTEASTSSFIGPVVNDNDSSARAAPARSVKNHTHTNIFLRISNDIQYDDDDDDMIAEAAQTFTTTAPSHRPSLAPTNPTSSPPSSPPLSPPSIPPSSTPSSVSTPASSQIRTEGVDQRFPDAQSYEIISLTPSSPPTSLANGAQSSGLPEVDDPLITYDPQFNAGTSGHSETTQETISSQQGDGESLPSHTLPVIMCGLASSVIFCAITLYCVDRRDRIFHEKFEKDQLEIGYLQDDNSSEKSMSFNHHGLYDADENKSNGSVDGDGGYWVHALMKDLVQYGPSKYAPPPNMLPPLAGHGEDDDQRDEMEFEGMIRGSYDLKERKGKSPALDELSISRVSTLTTSIMEGSYYLDDVEQQALPTSREAAEHGNVKVRSVHDPPIPNAMANIHRSESEEDAATSECSSLTDGTGDTTNSTTLLGEECVASLDSGSIAEILKSANEKKPNGAITYRGTETGSMERLMEKVDDLLEEGRVAAQEWTPPHQSQPRSQEPEQRDEVSVSTEMVKLEKFIKNINPLPLPVDDRQDHSSRRACSHTNHRQKGTVGRDIFFVPPSSGGKGNIGLTIANGPANSYPVVAEVDSSSTFYGRIFPKDMITRVNGKSTKGISGAEEVVQLMSKTKAPAALPECDESEIEETERTKMVKLTVVSTVHDVPDDDTTYSYDYGLIEGRQEI